MPSIVARKGGAKKSGFETILRLLEPAGVYRLFRAFALISFA